VVSPAALREKSNLLRRISLFLPVQLPLKKYFCFSEMQIRPLLRHPVPKEGRFAIVTNAGRGAVDADGASDESA
jgi:hypothetical protein